MKRGEKRANPAASQQAVAKAQIENTIVSSVSSSCLKRTGHNSPELSSGTQFTRNTIPCSFLLCY